MKLFLIRHGQTTGDIENRYGGDYDDHLTELGREQASKLAKVLQNQGIQKIFVSPRIRALETAQILEQKIKVTSEIIGDFRERNYCGVITGMTKDEVKLKYPLEAEKVRDYHREATGGEPYAQFTGRVSRALYSLAAQPYDIIALVTHGGPIRMIFRELLKKGEIDLDDCGYCVLEINGGNTNLLETHGITLKK